MSPPCIGDSPVGPLRVHTAEMADHVVERAAAQRVSRVLERLLLWLGVAFGVISFTVLSLSSEAGSSDASAGPLPRALTAAVYGSLAAAAFLAVHRPGRPLMPLVGLVVLWDGADWAGATVTPPVVRLVALSGIFLLPAVLFDCAQRWSRVPGARTRPVAPALYLAGALAAVLHFVAYEPFDDPLCRLTCIQVSRSWDVDPATARLASVVTFCVLLGMCLLAVVVLGAASVKSGSPGWWSSGAVLAAAALALAVVAMDGLAALVAPVEDVGVWPAVYLGRALTTLAVGAAMTASGAQAWRATNAVKRLGERLAEPAQLAASTSRALRDPDLRVDYWYAAGQRWVDTAGSPVGPAGPGGMITTLVRSGDVVARLVHGSRRPPPADLAQALGAATLLGIDNARLAAVARARLAEIRAARQRIVAGGDAERRRLERDLHDGAQQRLVSVALLLRMAGAEARTSQASGRLDLAEARARTIVSELRDIAHGIFPVVLAEEGLAAALFARIEAGSLLVTVEHVEERRFDADVEMAAYAVLDEALARADAAAAAAGAAPQVRVAVREREGLLEVDVSAEERDCLGTSDDAAFSDVADRVGALGGVVTLADGRDSGVRLRAAIPILR